MSVSARTVLLTDPDQRAALAAARALARGGYRVVTLGASRSLAGWSRAVGAHHSLPPERLATSHGLVDAVAEVVRAEDVSVVVPVTDAASRALLGKDDEVAARVAGPSADAYARASDKALLLTVAPACGIRVPRQVTLRRPDEAAPGAAGLAPLPWDGPTVVKPARSVVEQEGRAARVGVRFADDATSLAAAVAAYPPAAYPLLLQERTFGEGIGVFLLRVGGRTRLVFGHRRVREKPPAGGVSTCREAVMPPEGLVSACERLLDALGYHGAAMVEFKRDLGSGETVLMEINARLWGSLQLAIDAGVDFPTWLVRATLGEPLPDAPVPRAGVRTVWELGEVDHALALLRKGRAALHLPSDVPSGPRAAWRALLDHRLSDRPEVFRWTDPGPFAAELVGWLRRR